MQAGLNLLDLGKNALKNYVIAFIASLSLTSLAFYLVIQKNFSNDFILGIIVALAVIQMIIHIVYFLHLHLSSKLYWNVCALIYTLILICIIVGTSIWIMIHLNENMMAH
jgi:cytochrome o ubiquinol oxidase operon protein cyoD